MGKIDKKVDNFFQQEDTQNDLSVDDETIEEQQSNPILCKQIYLKKNVKFYEYIASLFHYLFMPFIFVSVEILQPALLQKQFNIQPENAGTQNSTILLVDIGVKLIWAPIFGILADRIGRKPVLIYGICVITLAIVLMPISTNLYPQYLIFRCIYAHGAICISVIPLLADYVQDFSKGRAAALTVIMASFGAMMSASLVSDVLVDKITNIKYSYWALAIIYLVCSLTYALLLKNNFPLKLTKEQQNQIKKNKPPRTCKFMMMIGWQASKNPWILMGYITNFLARNDSLLLSLYLIIWTYDKSEGDDYNQAYIQGHTLAGMAYMTLFLFTIVYGIMMEKFSKFASLLIMFTLTAMGGYMMIFAEDPKSAYTYIVMIVLGSGMSGLQTAALYLIQKYAYKEHRGYINGLSGIFSVLGIMVCVLTGFLIDTVNEAAPFISIGIISTISILILGYVYCKHVSLYKKRCQEFEELKDLKNIESEDILYEKNGTKDPKYNIQQQEKLINEENNTETQEQQQQTDNNNIINDTTITNLSE